MKNSFKANTSSIDLICASVKSVLKFSNNLPGSEKKILKYENIEIIRIILSNLKYILPNHN